MSKQQFQITGTITKLTDPETLGASSHQKRTVGIQTNEEYPQTAFIDFMNDKMALLDKLGTGETVTVHFNLKGRESNGRGYNSLNGYKIESN